MATCDGLLDGAMQVSDGSWLGILPVPVSANDNDMRVEWPRKGQTNAEFSRAITEHIVYRLEDAVDPDRKEFHCGVGDPHVER